MADPDLRAPAFAVYVNGTELKEDVTSKIVEVEFEHTLDMASSLKLVVDNIGNAFTDSPVFAPGNEVELHLGYGNEVGFVGRGEIVRHLPSFPQQDAPTLAIQGYDRSWRMMQQELEIKGGAAERPTKAKEESGEVYDTTLGTVVRGVFRKHGIEPDVDELMAFRPMKFTRKKGTTDYQLLRALANLQNADFFVEYDLAGALRGTAAPVARPNTAGTSGGGSGKWMGRFLKPGKTAQEKTYAFRYGTGEDGTLLSVDLEFGLPDTPSEVQVWVYDRGKAEWVPVTVEEKKAGKPEAYSPGTFVPGGEEAPEITSMTELRLAAAGHSVEVVTRKFRDPAEALEFAKDWLQKRKDSFVTAKGVLPGVESLRAGQTHSLEGLGMRYSGDYFFSSVTHKFNDNGYTTEFTGRKVVT